MEYSACLLATLFIYLCLLNGYLVRCQFLRSPRNIAMFAGDDVMFNCQVVDVSATIGWFDKADLGIVMSSDPLSITNGDDKYTVSGSLPDGEYNLHIGEVTMDYGGDYRCKQIFPSQDERRAHLIVLDGPVQCSDNTGGQAVEEGTEVEFYCGIQYQGFYGPMLTWSDRNGATQTDGISSELIIPLDSPPGSVPRDQPVGLNSTLRRTLTHEHDNIAFRCTMAFDSPLDSGDDAETYDAGIPRFNGQGQCTSQRVRVQYGPRNVRKYPTQGIHAPGDRVVCEWDSNPQQGRIEWIDDVSGSTIASDSSLLITEGMQGRQQYRCNVYITINGLEKNATEVFIFTVELATTTPPSTVASVTRPIVVTDDSGVIIPTGGPRVVPPTEAPESSLSSGAIAGIIIAAVVVVIIIIIIIFLVCRYSGSKKEKPKKLPADAVRRPDIEQITMPPQDVSFDTDEKPPSIYDNAFDNPQARNAENLTYADLALDNTPRSRNPIQVYEPLVYMEVQPQLQNPPPTPYSELSQPVSTATSPYGDVHQTHQTNP